MQSCFGKSPGAVILSLLACILTTQQLPAVQQLKQHVPGAAVPSAEVGRVPAAKRLKLAIGLPLRNTVVLTNLLQDLYDPASPDYRKFLTPQEFTSRFGPSEQDYEAVAAFFKSQGFAIKVRHPNRVLLDVEGSVGDIEKTLHVTMRQYRHPREARDFFAPDAEPRLDLNVPILHISGLDNFILPQPASLHFKPIEKDLGPVPNAGSGPNGTYMGVDFRAAYAPGVALNGAGQYVGLLQFDGYYPADITKYTAQAGMTNVPLINVYLDDVDGSAGANNIEPALDIEMCMSMAPGLSGIIVYEGQVGDDILNRMANDNLAKQLSSSWTFSTTSTTETIFQQMIAQGQAYFNSSGDRGAYTGTISTPADSPSITCVGGTTLSTRGPGQAWLSETTWNWANTGSGTEATGGGISTVWSIPTWQQGINMKPSQGSSSKRNIPDVAMVADSVFVISDNGQHGTVGGTSIATPLWAAFTALINQQAALIGQPPVGFLNPAVYSLAKGSGYAASFHDVTTGNNTNASSPHLFFAVTGYDLCTGWGTPTGRNLIDALAPPPNSAVIGAGTPVLVQETCSPGNGAVDPGEAVVMSLPLRNLGGVNTTNLTATLLASNGIVPLSGSQTYGALVGIGAAVAKQFSFVANGSCGSQANPVLQLQDGSADLGTVTFSIQLGSPVLLFAENFDTVAAPAVPTGWTVQRTGGGNNWVTSTSLRDSAPNSAFAFEPTNAGSCELISPVINVGSAETQLAFRNSYNTEVFPDNATLAYDGGVLEISIAGGGFTDILAAGGAFVSGGYTRTIQTAENPLNGRSVWAGISGGFVSTVVSLPAAAAGQPVQFKWSFGFDNGNAYGYGGWYIDSVSVQDGYSCCTASANADLAMGGSVYPTLGKVGQPIAYTFTVTNAGPGPALNVKVVDPLPANVSFFSASPAYINDGTAITWNLGLMTQGRSTNLLLLLSPTAEGTVTNSALVSSDTSDTNSANDTINWATPVVAPPNIVMQPAGQTTIAGSDVTLTVTAQGTAPLGYQWRFNSADLPGQTGSSLVLTNVDASNMGSYVVVVTNAAGSVSSTPVSVRVLVPFELSPAGLTVTATNTLLSVASITGLNYTLEYKDSLTDAAWTPVSGPAVGTGGMITLQDTNTPAALSRFYRVRTE
jgi:uncharacterized repeat protein (TIGR01451 family)